MINAVEFSQRLAALMNEAGASIDARQLDPSAVIVQFELYKADVIRMLQEKARAAQQAQQQPAIIIPRRPGFNGEGK